MEEEIRAFTSRSTWELIRLLLDKEVVGCIWVFAIKFLLDGMIE